MTVTRKTISVAWLEANNACNLEVCRQYFSQRAGPGFTDQTEFEITPEGIMRTSQARVLSTNWLAKRILDGPELQEYDRELNKVMEVFERTMAPILAGIVDRALRQKPPT